jgi:outer membrane protein assembly factor BamB
MARSITLLALLLGVASFALAQDCAHWRGPNNDGIAISKAGINTDWAATPPPVLWTVSMYDGGFAAPSVVGDKVYIEDHKGANDMVRCLELATGKQLWETPFAEKDFETRCTVTVADGKVYAATRSGRAACVDAKDGHLLWTRQLRDEFHGGPPANFGSGASPFVDGDMVIYCPGNKAGATVVALNKDTGETIWQGGSEQPGYGTPFAATFNGVRQYVVFTGSALISLKPETGEVLWRYEWREQENCNGNAPSVIGDNILINSGYDHGFALLDASKGTDISLIWKKGNGRAWGSKICSPIVYKDCIYLSSENMNFGCLDLKTGKELWSHDNGGDAGILMVDDVLFTLNSRDATLVMIKPEPAKYTELGRATVLPQGDAIVAPVFADNKLLVRNRKALACVDLSRDAKPAPAAP